MFMGLLVVICSLIADQFSKFWIDTQMVLDKPIAYGDYFNLVKVWNTGVSFSMFNDYGQAGAIILSVLALLVVAFLINWMRKETVKIKIFSLSLIVGGALGNVIDRVRFGAVLDFLDFHYKGTHWPAFNLADTFICIGAFILIYLEIFNGKKKGLSEI